MSDIDSSAEKVLADPFFGTLKRYIIETTGLSYYEDKDRDLAMAIARALDGAAFRTASAYLAEISAPAGPALDRLVEELTIGETFFFRHAEMFDALREHVFPEIHSRKADQRHLRIWSAGCSIGAEPYSLSIMLREDLAHRFHDWSIEIIGTDINRRFLRIAREATYESWALRGMPEETIRRYFDRQGKKWVLKRQFTEGITFQHHNLVRDRFPSLGNNLFALDLIICRNVMIYFTHATVRQLAEQFHQSLVPGGWLAVGHAEPHTEIFRAFRTVNAPGAILYQRPSAQAGNPLPGRWLDLSKEPVSSSPWQPPRLEIPAQPMLQKRDAAASRHPLAEAGENQAEQCTDLESVRQLADQGNLVSARNCCERLIEREKLNPAIHLLYGLILEQLEAFEAAREAFRRAIYLDRSMVLGHYHLGIVLQKLGEAHQALRSLRNAHALLAGLDEADAVRNGDGMTVGDLRNAIVLHTKQMSAPSVE